MASSLRVKPYYSDLKYVGFDFTKLRRNIDHGQDVIKSALYTSNKDLIRDVESRYIEEKIDQLMERKIEMELQEKRKQSRREARQRKEAGEEEEEEEEEVDNTAAVEEDNEKIGGIVVPKLDLDVVKNQVQHGPITHVTSDGDADAGDGAGGRDMDRDSDDVHCNSSSVHGSYGGFSSSSSSSSSSVYDVSENPWDYGRYDPHTARARIQNIGPTLVKATTPSTVTVQSNKAMPR